MLCHWWLCGKKGASGPYKTTFDSAREVLFLTRCRRITKEESSTQVHMKKWPLNGSISSSCNKLFSLLVPYTLEENSSIFSLVTAVSCLMPVATSKGMRAVKLCCYKILQFLTAGAG